MIKEQVVCLHGFTGHPDDFLPIFNRLGAKFHYLAPFLPGHGPSPSFCDYIKWLNQIFAEFSEPVTLLGYSMGGRLALNYALENPDKVEKLVLIAVNPGLEREKERADRLNADQKLAKKVEVLGIDGFIEFWHKTPLIRSQKKNIPEEIYELMRQKRLEHTVEGLQFGLDRFSQGKMAAGWGKLRNLSIPTYMIVGEEDTMYADTGERMAKLIPKSELFTIKNAGHMAHLENLEDFLQVFENIIEKTEKSANFIV